MITRTIYLKVEGVSSWESGAYSIYYYESIHGRAGRQGRLVYKGGMNMKRTIRKVFFIFAAVLMGCASTGQPLLIADLDETGWDNAAAFQCYLSSKLTLTKLPGDSGSSSVTFSQDGAANVREARWTITLPASLEGRILDYHKRDQYLYVAFEEGVSTLPFALDRDGRFSLMSTIDQNNVEFVEYEGSRYKLDSKPHLNVVINRSQTDLRRQMQGQRESAQRKSSETLKAISEKLINDLPENSIIAVLNISSNDKNTAISVRDEIEYLLVESRKFKIVDRKSLDAVQDERSFQMSGEVSDESAVSLGNMLGANIVINGNISGAESSRTLTLKALDVETAEILSTAREAF
jgi:hypothetical protein